MLSGPLIALPSHVPEFLKPIGRAVGRLFPGLPLVPIDLQALSRDPGVVTRYREDPLVYFRQRACPAQPAPWNSFTFYIQPRLFRNKAAVLGRAWKPGPCPPIPQGLQVAARPGSFTRQNPENVSTDSSTNCLMNPSGRSLYMTCYTG